MNSTSEIERQKEAAIDALRLRAFETNSDADRQAYFDAVSKWFQDRHIRRVDAERVPFLPVQGAVKKLEWRKGRAETPFGPYHVIEETNDDEPSWFVMFNGKAAARCGTHDDEESAIFAAQADYSARILSALEPTAARSQALEEAAHNLINELSGNTGELIDMMASAIRADGSDLCDGAWESLSDDRKLAWRGDAERPLQQSRNT